MVSATDWFPPFAGCRPEMFYDQPVYNLMSCASNQLLFDRLAVRVEDAVSQVAGGGQDELAIIRLSSPLCM